MPISYGILLALMFLVITIVAIVKKMKKKSRQLMAGIGILGLVVAGYAVAVPGAIPQLDQTFTIAGLTAAPTAPAPGAPLVDGVCVGIEDTTVTVSGQDKFTASASGGTHRYRINNNPALTISDAGTFTASPGDVVSILFGNETSNSYFGVVKTETIPCAGTHTISTETIQNGTLSISIFNEEGNIVDGNSENETITNGDTVNLKIEIRGTNNRGFPYGGVFVIEMNGTEYDEEDTDLSFVGLSVTKTTVPAVHTPTYTSHRSIAFEVGAFEEADLRAGTLTLVADSTNDPTDGADPTITFRANDYFINEDTGGSYDGPAIQDEDNVITFGHETSATIHVD